MPEEIQDASPASGGSSMVKNLIIGVLGLYVVLSLYFSYTLNERIHSLEVKQATAEEKLGKKIAETKSQMQEASEDLSQKMGVTQKEIASRSAELRRQQKDAESRLTEEQKKQQEALGQVSSAVTGVKTDVGGVRTDVAATKSDLEATKAKLERTIGDLNIQSGLVAKNGEELDILKHKGDRNYYEFTLDKGKTPQTVSTVALLLKKTDVKKGKFTLNVIADDKTIEKKDRNIGEPLQFYTGRDRMLYELVVFNLDKNKISGYIATPKNAPVPITKQ